MCVVGCGGALPHTSTEDCNPRQWYADKSPPPELDPNGSRRTARAYGQVEDARQVITPHFEPPLVESSGIL
jgi:hypothetical protein